MENKNLEEEKIITSLRAIDWSEFIGQEKVKQSVLTSIKAAQKRKEPLDHLLFYGPPGLGKTTLAHLIAKVMNANLRITSGPAIEHSGDLASILTNMEPGDVLFIDEIHRLGKVVEEMLYPVMEDFCLDIVIGKGPSARTVRLDMPAITIIGATTRIGLLSAPLRDRFGATCRLSFYNPEELSQILKNAAQKLKVPLDEQARLGLARRSRGTPRIAIKLLKRVRDVAQVHGKGKITSEILDKALVMLEVDQFGLDSSDRRLLETIIVKFDGGPVGIETLSAAISEDIQTIEDVLEPYLMQLGFLKRTPRGRVVTSKAREHLKKEFS